MLDALNVPNAAFSQFLGPDIMVFFFLSFPCLLFSCLIYFVIFKLTWVFRTRMRTDSTSY